MNSHDPLYVKEESSMHWGDVRGLHTSLASAQERDNKKPRTNQMVQKINDYPNLSKKN